MSLFYSFNHIIIFFLFAYLGLVLGLIFTFFNTIIKKINKKAEKAFKKGENCKKIPKRTQTPTKYEKFNSSPQNGAKNNKKSFKLNLISKINTVFIKLTNILSKTITNVFTIICLLGCVLISFYYNLKFNYGEIRFVYVVVWIVFFFIGKTLCKMLANYFLCFYNYFIKRKETKWVNNKTTIHEKQS